MADKVPIWPTVIPVILLLLFIVLGAFVSPYLFAFAALSFVALVITLVVYFRRRKLRVSKGFQIWGVAILSILLLIFTVLSALFYSSLAFFILISLVVLISIVHVGILVHYCGRKKLGGESNHEASTSNELTDSDCFGDVEAIGYNGNEGRGLQQFSFATIMSATDGFSMENKLGRGGFGPVFKGKLPGGKEIAVKRLLTSSGQGTQEFKNELILIAGTQHMNLVRLLGSCVEGDEKMLVYEYMPNKSLDFYLFDETRKRVLDWKKRYTIIDGIAQGLIYLHKYSRIPIIHRDLKPGNILLDANMNPKISDFGTARIFDRNKSEANTLRIIGTYGYMSLEYAMEGIFSEKSDVYSFGVILLEIVSGRKVSDVLSCQGEEDPLNLVGCAWKLWKEGRSMELIDSTLEDQSTRTQIARCIHVGLLCIQDHAAKRPTMSHVIPMISNETVPLPNPEKPTTVFTRQKLQEILNSSSGLRRQECFSINEASISDMEPR